MAPIHFPAHPRILPQSWGLCAYTHALSLLAGRPFPLPFLVTFPLIIFLIHLYYICSPDLQLASPMPFPSYWYPSYYILNPLPDYRSMTSSPSCPCHTLGRWLSSFYHSLEPLQWQTPYYTGHLTHIISHIRWASGPWADVMYILNVDGWARGNIITDGDGWAQLSNM
jgi:hypothetical protein